MPVVLGGGRPVAGAGGVRPVGDERVRGRRRPASRQVSQSWGRATAATRAAFSGSASRSQRSLVTVSDATGTEPDRVGPRLRRRRSSAMRSARAGAERVSFHSSASRTTSPSASSATMPCCWPPTEIALDVVETPGLAIAVCRASHQCRGRPRCRRGATRARAHERAGRRRRARRPCRTASTSPRRRRGHDVSSSADVQQLGRYRGAGPPRAGVRPERAALRAADGQRAPRACSRASWLRRTKPKPRAATASTSRSS